MRFAVFVAVLALAGCQPQPEEPIITEAPGDGPCQATELAHLLGQPATAHDFNAMDRPVRILPPGALMTQEYLPNRLNVNLDGSGNIVRLWCG